MLQRMEINRSPSNNGTIQYINEGRQKSMQRCVCGSVATLFLISTGSNSLKIPVVIAH